MILGLGMLGHKVYQVFKDDFDTYGTIRGSLSDISKYEFYDLYKIIPNVDARILFGVNKAIEKVKPDVVINCIGMVKSQPDVMNQIWVNALFPHQLNELCKDIRLIHISTDCVFSGKKGNYKELDDVDADDIYGKTKYLGELNNALTIRTSVFGRELGTSRNLIEWFLKQKEINGYTNAYFSGFSTLEFANILKDIIKNHTDLKGLYHISSKPISKFSLLTRIKDAMNLDIVINSYPDYNCNRSLDSSYFRSETGFIPKSWDEMIEEFVKDAKQYTGDKNEEK